MFWTDAGKKEIADLKKCIIKKKIMLGFMIDGYAWWDRIFKYCHAALALCIPLISFIAKLSTTTNEELTTTVLVLSSIVAGMIKLKENLKFDKIVTLAQQQTVKYKQLYQRIEREMVKHEDRRQSEEDFLYWIKREYSGIEMADPELTHNMRKKFIALCKEKGIPFDEDMELLADLLQSEAKELAGVVIEKVVDAVVSDEDIKDYDIKNYDTKVHVDKSDAVNVKNVIDLKTMESIEMKTPVKPDVTENPSAQATAETTPEPTPDTTPHATPKIRTRPMYTNTIRARSPSSVDDRKKYKETMKNFNPSKDMQWALDRLKDV